MNDLRIVNLDFDFPLKVHELIGEAVWEVEKTEPRRSGCLSVQNRQIVKYLKAKSRLEGIKDTLSLFYGEEKTSALFELYEYE